MVEISKNEPYLDASGKKSSYQRALNQMRSQYDTDVLDAAIASPIENKKIVDCVLENCQYEPLQVGWIDHQLRYRTGTLVGVEGNFINVLENGYLKRVLSEGSIEIAPVLERKTESGLEWRDRFDNATEGALDYLSEYHRFDKPKFPLLGGLFCDARVQDFPTWVRETEVPLFPKINEIAWALAGKKRTAALLKAWCDIYKKYREDLRREMVVKLGLQNMRSEQVRRGEA